MVGDTSECDLGKGTASGSRAAESCSVRLCHPAEDCRSTMHAVVVQLICRIVMVGIRAEPRHGEAGKSA